MAVRWLAAKVQWRSCDFPMRSCPGGGPTTSAVVRQHPAVVQRLSRESPTTFWRKSGDRLANVWRRSNEVQ